MDDKLKKIEQIYNNWKRNDISSDFAMKKIGEILGKGFMIKDIESFIVRDSQGNMIMSSGKTDFKR